MITELVRQSPKSGTTSVERRTVFISHATPEDNEFVRWLAAQMVMAGYEVWCDVTQLLGGERFWADIEDAIDQATCRFLFVSTLHGNSKPGSLRELRLAQRVQAERGLKDFIVPLKIDQFPFQSMQPGLSDLNIVRFDETWAAGLRQLLLLLEREGVPKSPTANASAVLDWYSRSIDSTRRPVVSNDDYLSNWFKLTLPIHLYAHPFAGPADHVDAYTAQFPYAHKSHSGHLLTFVPPAEVHLICGNSWKPDSKLISCQEFLEGGSSDLGIEPFDAGNILSDLVRQSWERAMSELELKQHTLASGLIAWYFANGALEGNKAFFVPTKGRRTYRQLVGNKSKRLLDGTKIRDGHWHYALSGSPQLHPFPRMVLRHHVVFTDDGEKPWDKAERMHKARRSVCKNWWNREWRDRLLAFRAQLSDPSSPMQLQTGGDPILLDMSPMRFTSPLTYFEGNETGLDEAAEIELVEEETEDERDEP